MTIANTFTTTCPCGVTIHFIEGVEQPHDCAPIPPQAVRDAWAAGYEAAHAETARASATQPYRLGAAVMRDAAGRMRTRVPIDPFLDAVAAWLVRCADADDQFRLPAGPNEQALAAAVAYLDNPAAPWNP